MIVMFLLIGFFVIWQTIAISGYITAIKTFKKYSQYSKPQNMDAKYNAIIRTDFDKWNKEKILFGCFTLLPIRVLLYASMIFGCVVFAVFMTIFGPTSLLRKGLTIYMNTYGKLVTRLLCNIKEQFENKSIQTPIVISNHVNWFDIFYLVMGHSPVSFVSKAQVGLYPIIGALAQAIQCVFVKRQSGQDRTEAKSAIKQRVQDISNNKKGKYPLVIFPEGTTSNGNGLLTFKSGAFDNLSPITAFCLKYECMYFITVGQNLDMGLDEITQIQHVVLMMSQYSRLIVKKQVFTPDPNQDAKSYSQRCRQSMAETLGIQCTEGGFRDKQKFEKFRNGKKSL